MTVAGVSVVIVVVVVAAVVVVVVGRVVGDGRRERAVGGVVGRGRLADGVVAVVAGHDGVFAVNLKYKHSFISSQS